MRNPLTISKALLPSVVLMSVIVIYPSSLAEGDFLERESKKAHYFAVMSLF